MRKDDLINEEVVEHVSTLAHLRLSDDEKTAMKEKLGDILVYMEKLNELDTSSVKETYHSIDVKNVKRADETTGQSLSREEALENAPSKGAGFFKVPKIIENNS